MARIVAGFEQAARIHDVARSSMNALIPETAACTTHRAVLDRAEAAHLQVLFGGGGPVVGRVVDHDDEEAGSLAGHLAIDRREAVLVADRRPDRRETRGSRSATPRCPGSDRPEPGRSPRSNRAPCGTARTPRTAPASPSRTGRRSRPPRRTRASRCAAVPSGSSVTRAGDRRRPTVAIAWLTAVIMQGVRRDPGIERSLPQTTRSGGSSASWRWRSMFSRATAHVLVRTDAGLGPSETSTWIVATSSVQAVRSRDRDRRRGPPPGRRPRRPGRAPPLGDHSPPLPREQQQTRHHHHQEGQGPHPADGREGQRGGVDLGHAELPPVRTRRAGSPSDPLDDGPQARQPERAEQRRARVARRPAPRPRTPP